MVEDVEVDVEAVEPEDDRGGAVVDVDDGEEVVVVVGTMVVDTVGRVVVVIGAFTRRGGS